MATIKRGGLQYNIGPNQKFIPEEAPRPTRKKPNRLRRMLCWLLKKKRGLWLKL